MAWQVQRPWTKLGQYGVGQRMTTKGSRQAAEGRATAVGTAAEASEQLRARIRDLQAELARLESHDNADHAAGGAARLTTVKVPAPFEAPFLRAQEYVARYFANRIEQPDT